MSYVSSRREHLIDRYNFAHPGNRDLDKHILKGGKESAEKVVLHSRYKAGFERDLRGNLQRDANHLNSSQMFCFNLMEPMRSVSQLSMLKCLLARKPFAIPLKGNIVDTRYEYVASTKENTHFDFVVKTDLLETVYFEFKYTESGFKKGKLSSERVDFYRQWFHYSSNLKDLINKQGESELERHYQIYRNVSYVRGEHEFSVFLFPRANKVLDEDLSEVRGLSQFENVRVVHVEDVIDALLSGEVTGSKALMSYYKNFDDFYLS